jgi:hypothetical protein
MRGVALTLGNLADLQLLRGAFAAAGAELEEMLAVAEELGNAEIICGALNFQAIQSIELGDAAAARDRLRRSLNLSYPNAYWESVAEALLVMAALAVLESSPERSLLLALVAQRMLHSGGGGMTALQRRLFDRVTSTVNDEVDQETQTALRARAHSLTVDEAVVEAVASTGETRFRAR